MGLDKVILRAFLTTLAAICALIAFTILGLCVLFPSTSMELTYDMGMSKSCIHFAERAYRGTEEVYFIAYATEVAIEEDETSKIVSCGEKFLEDENFKEYCELKGETYAQFIYGKVCVSKYESGDKSGAVELAYQSLKGAFPEGNALVSVLLTSLNENDLETVNLIKAQLNEVSVIGEEQEKYLEDVLTLLEIKG
jgi:hypothetical protein